MAQECLSIRNEEMPNSSHRKVQDDALLRRNVFSSQRQVEEVGCGWAEETAKQSGEL